MDPPPAAPTTLKPPERPEPIVSAHLQMSQQELEDPFGKKAAAIAAREELLAERETEAPETEPEPEDPPAAVTSIVPTSSRMTPEERANM